VDPRQVIALSIEEGLWQPPPGQVIEASSIAARLDAA